MPVAAVPRTVDAVRTITMAVAGLLLALAIAGPAVAQAKDPFRPVSGAGSGAAGGAGQTAPSGGPGTTTGVSAPQPGPSLPRTGLDYSLPALMSAVLVGVGASMRLAAAAVSR